MDRSRLNPALAAVPAADLIALGAELGRQHAVEHLAVPQEGLWLLTLRESVFGDRFHPGEIGAAQARVAVTDREGRRAEGGAAILGASRDLAEAAAICDAVLGGGLAGAERVLDLAAAGEDALRRRADARAAVRRATRVDFAELGQERA